MRACVCEYVILCHFYCRFPFIGTHRFIFIEFLLLCCCSTGMFTSSVFDFLFHLILLLLFVGVWIRIKLLVFDWMRNRYCVVCDELSTWSTLSRSGWLLLTIHFSCHKIHCNRRFWFTVEKFCIWPCNKKKNKSNFRTQNTLTERLTDQ